MLDVDCVSIAESINLSISLKLHTRDKKIMCMGPHQNILENESFSHTMSRGSVFTRTLFHTHLRTFYDG